MSCGDDPGFLGVVGYGVADYGQWNLRGACTCPSAWWGVVPPACPVHNPGTGRTFVATDTIPLAPAEPGLSDADVDRIARRVAELLKGG